MPIEPSITREISPLPSRRDDAHKGDVGRILIIGGHDYDPTLTTQTRTIMIGAPALAANAALRSGAGLVQMMIPGQLCAAALTIAPCATARGLVFATDEILAAINEFHADAIAVGPGLDQPYDSKVLQQLMIHFPGPMVIDAGALNLLAEAKHAAPPNPQRIVLTPHVGEAKRLLASRGHEVAIDTTTARREAACLLAEEFQCVVVLKGRGTLVTNGERLYINDTGNPGMATGGTGDVLTGVIAALLGQKMESFEAAILGVYLHGLAGDFAAEELGRLSMTAQDVIDYLPDAFCDHESASMSSSD